MFDSLSEKLGGILDRLTRRGALTEADVDAALREIRRALLEADVALEVARAFTEKVKVNAVGVELIKSVTPGQLVVKLVHDQLIATLGAQGNPIDLNAPAPVAIMLVGLQGSGKTTTAAKDRKSTRLNSSHSQISYAVFCVNKKQSRSCSFGDPSGSGSTDLRRSSRTTSNLSSQRPTPRPAPLSPRSGVRADRFRRPPCRLT